VPRRTPRIIAAGTAAILAASSLTLMAASPAFAVDGTVTGIVFRDFNANGVFDTDNVAGSGVANDQGFGGVTVTAYDADGGPSWTTTSADDGTYSIPVTGASDNTVRVEFTNLPAGYQAGAVHSIPDEVDGPPPAPHNGTAVQFVTLGSSDADFAVNAPEDYSQGNAPLATAIQWAGSPFESEGGTKGEEPALAVLNYDDSSTTPQQPTGFPGRVNVATYAEVGSVSSNVYQQSSNSIFLAASVKRQSGLGSLGLGGIYRVTDVLDADGAPSSSGSALPWLDVEQIGIDVGDLPTNTERGLSGHQVPTNDQPGFEQSAKAGIGDMVLSADGKTLFFINLFDKKLYSIDVSNPDSAPTTFQSFDLGLGTGERPWALTNYRGSLYVGYVDSGETDEGSQPGLSADAAGLNFHVISAPLSTLGSAAWTDVLTGDLGYAKGDVYQNALAPQSQRWNTWTDTWTWEGGRVAADSAGGGWHIYPQPVLSDLYFDEDGYLSLGFTDRTALQGGNRNLASDPEVPGNYETGASGDLLIAAPAAGGTFTLESNGEVGARSTTGGSVNEGPDGREFFDDTQILGNGSNHKEVTLGHLAGLRGTREVVSTAYDPLSGIRLAGLMWFDVDNGTPVAGYELNSDGQANGSGGNFQKGGGLGGISLLADAAPVEVGNRVWFDADKDGIQGPEEPAIAGLTVQLIKGGDVIGTATTDANGEYYFSSDPTSAFYVEGFEPNSGEYDIQFVKPATGNLTIPGETIPWATVSFTEAETASTENGSNPDPATGRYTFTVGGPGENNHSIDAGFVVDPQPSVDIEKGDNGGTGTAIVNDADTMPDGESYTAGETRTVAFTVTNTGNEPLREVTLTDDTLAGAGVQSLNWTFPDGSTAAATTQNGVLTAKWDATFTPGTATWLPNQVITGTATLTLGAGGVPHVDSARVTAVGAGSNIPVEDEDNYNAFVPDIQVIKYDGERPDPTVLDGDDWVTPVKPLTNAAQDANTADEAVVYPVNTPQSVRWVVTNTGSTSLTNITLSDVTNDGPAIPGDWTADLSPFGGPVDYSFVNDGPWSGILPPGASFFAEGTLTLAPEQTHSDTVTVVGTVVVPEVDEDGVPTGDPSLDDNGDPIVAIGDNDLPITLTDNDPFHARTGTGPFVDIEKGDNGGAGTTIVNDADTMTDGESYAAGETRTVVFTVTNTGDEELSDVTLTDETLAGAGVQSLTFTFPDGSTADATLEGAVLTAKWDATFAPGTTTWLPGDVITGAATLTLGAAGVPHVDTAKVTARGAQSDIPVEDEDNYNAFVPDIQVIKYDGERPDPVVNQGGDWVTPVKPLTNAAQDANTADEAVVYPVNTPQTVRWVVTNTGSTSLTNITLSDVTNDGPAVGADWTADLSPFGGPVDYSFVNDGPWAGILPPGASFFAEGTLQLGAQQTHSDTVTVVGTVVLPEVDGNGVPTGEPSLDENGVPVVATDDNDLPITLTDDDPFHARTGTGPFVDIEKGDNGGTGTTIANDADTMVDGESYTIGETRTVVFTVTNTGDEALSDVTLTDETLAGAGVQSLSFAFPDGSTTSATLEGAVLTAKWDATFAPGTTTWLPGDVITGTASLTLGAAGVPHVDTARVTAVGAQSNIPVEDEDNYNAFVPAIQVIKYDGERPDPIVTENGNWITPAKPLADSDQDANTTDKSVVYPVNTPQSVRWVVTNTGSTSLTNITLGDVTNTGPAVGADWTADLSPFGGPAEYSFVEDGPWAGILPPGASFFAEGTLSLAAQQTHSDTVTVVGTVVLPEVDGNGVPTGEPSLDENGVPVVATDDNDLPITLTDNDPFHARTGVGPFVDIEKGDGTGTTITNDADTMATGQVYTSGETREIVFVAENTGDEPLRNVVLTEDALSGAEVVALEWTFPDGTTAKAEEVDGLLTANWKASFAPGTATWLPGQEITGHATLTITADQPAHVDLAKVNAVGAQSEIPVADEDPYNAYTGAIQVIKYDGNRPDPAVTDGTNWIIPAKPLVTPSQDANTDALAVEVKSGVKNTVRWVVTNTGTTTLTHLELTDMTNSGVAISGDWTADLSAFGGPSAYSFVNSGPWDGMLPPGASFFAEGTLTLGVGEQHADTVTVVGQVVVPEVDENGLPTGKPSVDADGKPVVAQRDGKPFTVTDNDPFHAKVPSVLASTGVAGGMYIFSLVLLLIGGGLLLRTRWLPMMARRKS